MDTKLLEKITLNTEPKNTFNILNRGKSTRIRTLFNPPIQLDQTKSYEMALVSLETYYSFQNIDSKNNNFRYSPDNGANWIDINIPEGSYEITDINRYVQRIMKANGHYDNISIEPNDNTLKCVVQILSPYKVDFTTANSIRTVLGFNSQIYSDGYNESENIVKIHGISRLFVTSDIIGVRIQTEVQKTLYTRFSLMSDLDIKSYKSPKI